MATAPCPQPQLRAANEAAACRLRETESAAASALKAATQEFEAALVAAKQGAAEAAVRPLRAQQREREDACLVRAARRSADLICSDYAIVGAYTRT